LSRARLGPRRHRADLPSHFRRLRLNIAFILLLLGYGTKVGPTDGHLTIEGARSQTFRPGVGIMLLNRDDGVLVRCG
jgi:hypothetical protein